MNGDEKVLPPGAWVKTGKMTLTLTDVNPEMFALLAGAQRAAQTRPIQLDYQTPVKLPWWHRVWLWVHRKPVPTVQRRIVIPNATVRLTEPTEGTP
jgi:hypothetical protein